MLSLCPRRELKNCVVLTNVLRLPNAFALELVRDSSALHVTSLIPKSQLLSVHHTSESQRKFACCVCRCQTHFLDDGKP